MPIPAWGLPLVVYLGTISAAAVFVTVLDKWKAQHGKWRIPEATLLLFSALGGSLAMLATMRCIHHKTRKPKFMVGIPVILVLQLLAAGGVAWLLLR